MHPHTYFLSYTNEDVGRGAGGRGYVPPFYQSTKIPKWLKIISWLRLSPKFSNPLFYPVMYDSYWFCAVQCQSHQIYTIGEGQTRQSKVFWYNVFLFIVSLHSTQFLFICWFLMKVLFYDNKYFDNIFLNLPIKIYQNKMNINFKHNLAAINLSYHTQMKINLFKNIVRK